MAMSVLTLTKSTNKFIVVFSPDILKKNASQNKAGAVQIIQRNHEDAHMISFSQEARNKLLEDRAVEMREKAQKMVDSLREKSRRIQEADNSRKKEALQQKIADTKQRLKALVEMMRSALLFGDKKAAALIAKEAARLAKELAAALKEYGSQDTGGDISIPELNSSNDSEKADGPENVENIEPVEDIGTGVAEHVAASEASLKKADGEEENADLEGADSAKDAIKGLANEKLQEAKKTRGGSGMDDELKIIVAMLRSIASMARATAKGKSNLVNNLPKNSHAEVKTTEDIEKAAGEIEKAVKEIEAAMGTVTAR